MPHFWSRLTRNGVLRATRPQNDKARPHPVGPFALVGWVKIGDLRSSSAADDAISVAQAGLEACPDQWPGGFEGGERSDAGALPGALPAVDADYGVIVQEGRLPGDAVVAPRIGCGVDAHQLNGGEVSGWSVPVWHGVVVNKKDLPDGYVGHEMGDGRSPCDGGYARHTWVAGSGAVRSAAGWMMPAATSCSR